MSKMPKERTKSFSELTFRQKLQFISDYYKWPIIITICVIAAVSVFIYEKATEKDCVFYTVFINSNVVYESQTALLTDFEKTLSDFDPAKQEMSLDSGITIDYDNQNQMTATYIEKLMAMYNSGQVDVTVANKAVISNYAEQEAFVDLSKYLPSDLYQELKDKGYTFYTCKTENLGNAPVGIYIKDCPVFKNGCKDTDGNACSFFPDKDGYEPVLAISFNAPDKENAIAFIRYLTSEQ